jgi:serine phosphatase RsbU (regulator of sigma subunit)
LLYGILHSRTGEFLYARAGHDLPLILDDAGRVIETPQGSGQLLGLFPDPELDEL